MELELEPEQAESPVVALEASSEGECAPVVGPKPKEQCHVVRTKL